MDANLGIIFALGSSVCWAFSPIFFSKAGQKIGPLAVNVYRLIIASVLLWLFFAIFQIFNGFIITIPKYESHLWLFLSAFAGLIAGDYLYLKSLINIGPRRTTQIQTLSPIFSMCVAWIAFNETIGAKSLIGIISVATGLAIVVIGENNNHSDTGSEPGRFSFRGYFVCLLGVIGHGSGAAFTRKAFLADPSMDFSYATAFRVSSAALIMFLIAKLSKTRNKTSFLSVVRGDALAPLFAGVMAGPVIGMLFYISALKYSPAGIVSALSSLAPIIIIPVAIVFYRLKMNIVIFTGTLIAVTGVVLIGIVK